MNEETLREDTVCVGCGLGKNIGNVVCWNCFKHHKYPYKYFTGSIEQWLLKIKE